MVCAATVLLAALVAALVVLAWRARAPGSSATARALARNGWVVYVREGCGPCAKQKQVLAELGFTRIVHHDASGQRIGPVPNGAPTAPPGGLKAFPTWLEVPTGTQVKGFQSAAQLAAMAK